jgi:hypothetical protein
MRSYFKNDFAIVRKLQSTNNQKLVYLIDVLLTAFIFTPVVVFYWASTWDIIFVYILPKDFLLSCLVTFIFTNWILSFSYLFQNDLQNYYNKISMYNNSRKRRFLIRFIYTYFLAAAYVSQWRTYWDFYSYYTENVPFYYFAFLSILALFLYRYILKKSIAYYVKSVPFYFDKDENFETYFHQSESYVSAKKLILKQNLL